MTKINGYVLDAELTAKNAGDSLWGFAKKDGAEYFIKQRYDYVYPNSKELSPKTLEKKRKRCDAFYAKRKRFVDELARCRTGNNVVIEDFFLYDSHFYEVTNKISRPTLSVDAIANLSEERKRVLFRSILYSIGILHEHGIVHSDIKPSNLLVVRTSEGYCTAKIIDFGFSFFETELPEEIGGDQVYFAPEAWLRAGEREAVISTKMDIFSLGVLFHQYWTGKLPEYAEKYLDKEYNNIGTAVCDGVPVDLDPGLPADVSDMIGRMLLRDPALRPSAREALVLLGGKEAFVAEDKKPSSPFHRPEDR